LSFLFAQKLKQYRVILLYCVHWKIVNFSLSWILSLFIIKVNKFYKKIFSQ
jgi:hypothetical protein